MNASSASDEYTCPECGVPHHELSFTYGFAEPYMVGQINDQDFSARVEMGSDNCIVDGNQFFVKGSLEIPIAEINDFVRISVWVKVTADIWDEIDANWDVSGREKGPPLHGKLSNTLPGYENTRELDVLLHTRPVGLKPFVEIQKCEHLLHFEQHQGVSVERALALIHIANSGGGGRVAG